MLTRLNPPSVPKPASRYAQGILVPANARQLVISGQIGVTPDGKVLEGVAAQTEQAFANLFAMLAAAGMGVEDIVKVTVFLTNAADVPVYREVRDRMLTEAAASTLLIVAGLASPAFLVEIEATAAKVA
ncbi:MAG: RidA family protein [Thalassobaculales bacterium]